MADATTSRRRRAIRARALAVAAVLVAYAAIKVLTGPPADDAVKLVPGDAYLYLHVNLDRGSGQFERAEKLARRLPGFPLLVQTVLDRLSGGEGGRFDFDQDVRPWLGDEAALALMPSRGAVAGSAILIETDDRRRANRFLARISGRGARADYRGVQLRRHPGNLVTASIGGFLVAGQEVPVKRAIDTARGRERSLAGDPVARAARGPLPGDRLADGYASRDGVRRLLARRGGLTGQVGAVLDHPALRGVAAALVARDGGLDLTVRSSLDPQRNRRRQAFGAFPAFEPSLTGEAPADSLIYLGVSNPARTFDRLLEQARATLPGLAAGAESFISDLGRRGRLNLRRQLLPLLKGEAGVSVAPAIPAPVLTVVVKGVDERRARAALARLQGPLARAVSPRRGRQAPVFRERRIGGVESFSIRLSPSIDLTYALFDRKLVVSTDPRGVRQVRSGRKSLRGARFFKAATGSLPDRVSSLLFLNLDQLLAIAERTGLAEDPAYAEVRDDLRRLKALGAAVTGDADHLETKISLAIP